MAPRFISPVVEGAQQDDLPMQKDANHKNIPLRVLIVEDNAEDAELLTFELRRGGYLPVVKRVESGAEMRRALQDETWDLVLSDYSLPRFSMLEALEMVQERKLDVPFLIVSATIGEDAAVDAMKAGAHDYILKHKLGKLVPAIQRELRESAVRRERRNLEEHIRQAQRLESIGLLAGGVAHDFNNLLTGIMGNASLVLELWEAPQPAKEMLEDVVRATERAADLTRQLLAYAGKGRFVLEQVNLSSVIQGISELMRTSVSKKVELALELDQDVPTVEADKSQMQQLVMNLVVNAAEAIGDDPGIVMIRTGVEHVNTPDLAPGDYVFLEVRDTGCGMTEEIRRQIFEPFFTTKFTGRGLGLAAAHGIMRAHKGRIDVQSCQGEGSTFKVLLPAMGKQAPAPAVEPVSLPEERSLSGQGIVLVVDDEPVVRRTARASLERYGYIVYEAEDGPTAINLFEKLSESISLVLLDLTMPLMSGEEVYSRLVEIRPGLTVVVSSGYDEAEAKNRMGDRAVAGFVKKPYTSAQLAHQIKTALSRRPRTMRV